MFSVNSVLTCKVRVKGDLVYISSATRALSPMLL